MHFRDKGKLIWLLHSSLLIVGGAATLALSASQALSQTPASAPAGKSMGTIKAIEGHSLTLHSDSASDIVVAVDGSTRLVRVAPGQKDLNDAVPIPFSNLEVGDRILVRGPTSDDGKSLAARGIIVMKRSDVEAKQAKDREAWQRNGVGGLVSAIDLSNGVVTISAITMGGKRNLSIRVSKSTLIRRYAPDSVRFDDAQPSALDRIKPGDQLRARGTGSADGSEITADEIVSGSFRNIAGTLMAIDGNRNTIRVMDAISKKPVQVKMTPDSELRRLPMELAQRIALRLQSQSGGPQLAQPAGTSAQSASMVHSQTGAEASDSSNGTPRGGAGGDLQQILRRLPASRLTDLAPGAALMIVSSESVNSSAVTAITVLAGVEPILAASPKGGEGMVLSPWNLGGGSSREDSNP